jgi:AcrR family transcriptional regulator
MAEDGTRRQLQARKTKRALFDSAIALFKEKGFDEVTVEEIARRAGTSKGSFYTYFPTKSAIIIEEFTAIDEYYRKYARNLRRYTNTREKLLAFTRTQLRYVRDNIGLEMLKLLYSNQLVHPQTEKILVDRKRYLHELMSSIFSAGQVRGEVRGDMDADRLAQLFNRSMRSIFLDWAITDNSFDLVREGLRFCEEVLLPAFLLKDHEGPGQEGGRDLPTFS